MLLVVAFAAVPFVVAIPREPREALSEVAEAIDELPSSETPVFAYVYNPGDLEFHLGRRVAETRTSAELRRACSQAETTVLVDADLAPRRHLDAVSRTGRPSTYALRPVRAGDAIDMWVIPPSGGTS